MDLTTNKVVTPTNQPAAVYTQTASTPNVATANVRENASVGQVDQQLIQLWKQASKAERQKFMNWLGEQAN